VKRISLVFYILFFSTPLLFASVPREVVTPPAPRLLAPNDRAVLAKGEDLEFRWGSESLTAGQSYFDFRLYRGTQLLAYTLILKKKVPSTQSTFRVKSDQFQDGQLYAWSVREVGTTKSRSNYSIFKVEFKK
jgi:hypothetical protein